MAKRVRVFGAAFALVLPTPALAAGPDELPERDAPPESSDFKSPCRRSYSVFNPTPSECLGAIVTDRPSKTDTPKPLEPGHVQLEAGLVEAGLGGVSSTDLTVMSNLYKVGIVNRVDLEMAWTAGTYAPRTRRFQWNGAPLMRSKINIIGGEPGAFALTLLPVAVLPVGKTARAEAGGFVLLGSEVGRGIEAQLNAGAISETDTDTGRRHASAAVMGVLSREIVGPLGGFVELYGATSTQDLRQWQATFDTGLVVLATKSIQADVGAHFGVWGDVPLATPYLGLSSRY